jgi:hypothetical protein
MFAEDGLDNFEKIVEKIKKGGWQNHLPHDIMAPRER